MTPTYSNPKHPGHIAWKLARRKRFVQLLKEARKMLQLEQHERAAITVLIELIRAGSAELENLNN